MNHTCSTKVNSKQFHLLPIRYDRRDKTNSRSKPTYLNYKRELGMWKRAECSADYCETVEAIS